MRISPMIVACGIRFRRVFRCGYDSFRNNLIFRCTGHTVSLLCGFLVSMNPPGNSVDKLTGQFRGSGIQ
jgi:hypothetical protein